MENKNVKIKIVSGVEGKSCYINDKRVSGNKPWGGGRIIYEFNANLNDTLKSINIG